MGKHLSIYLFTYLFFNDFCDGYIFLFIFESFLVSNLFLEIFFLLFPHILLFFF